MARCYVATGSASRRSRERVRPGPADADVRPAAAAHGVVPAPPTMQSLPPCRHGSSTPALPRTSSSAFVPLTFPPGDEHGDGDPVAVGLRLLGVDEIALTSRSAFEPGHGVRRGERRDQHEADRGPDQRDLDEPTNPHCRAFARSAGAAGDACRRRRPAARAPVVGRLTPATGSGGAERAAAAADAGRLPASCGSGRPSRASSTTYDVLAALDDVEDHPVVVLGEPHEAADVREIRHPRPLLRARDEGQQQVAVARGDPLVLVASVPLEQQREREHAEQERGDEADQREPPRRARPAATERPSSSRAGGRRACPRPARAARTGPRPAPDSSRFGCSRRSPRSNGSAGAKAASTGSRRGALPVTVTRGSTRHRVRALARAGQVRRISSTSAWIARRSRVPRDGRLLAARSFAPVRAAGCAPSRGRRSRRASSRMRPAASTGCRASSRYPNETRSLGTSRRKIGSPVVTRPSGYTAFRRTDAEYSKRPWWTYASATVST